MKRAFIFILLAAVAMNSSAYGSYPSSGMEQPWWLILMGFLMIAWGILEIILFFKVWAMTNDVHKLAQKFCSQAPKPVVKQSPSLPSNYEQGEYMHALDSVKPGDKVRRLSDGKVLVVVSIGENALECRGGMLDGIHSYPKDSLTTI